jgi:23S rRNA pseudouridine1911/1915/1917 synthase
MQLTCTAQRSAKLSSILQRELRLSTGLIKHLKYEHAFCVNGTPQFTNFRVQPGDVVTVRLEEAPPDYPAQVAPLSILYEDEAILAVDKPAGMMVHPSATRNTETLANYLYGYYLQTGQKCAVHPVTRLDRDTLGVVLVAKNAHIHALLCELQLTGQVQKTYSALVFGAPEQDSGVIDAPIVRPDPMRMQRAVGENGLRAVTEYQVLRRGETSLLALRPITGRTHQLRVHCLHLGCPIVGDPQYFTAPSKAYSEAHGIEAQLLCARRLEFPHPLTGEPVVLESAQGDWK